MTVKEAAQVLAILQAAYPSQCRNVTPESAQGTISVWAVQFADIPADIVLIAANKWIATNEFFPSPYKIKNKIGSLYWEASEKLQKNLKVNTLTSQEVAFYTRIKNVAKKVKDNKSEPTIDEIVENHKVLGKNNYLMIGGNTDV